MSAAVAQQPTASKRALEVIIVGAGIGGIAAAIELRRHGIERIRILEKAADLGGTWFYNSYPGSACDVPSHLYSFSYAQRRDWSRLCSPQAEIHAYLHDVARAHGVEQLVQTDTTVHSCTWDEPSCRWTVETDRGESHQADALILATGQLHQPARPAIMGAGGFAGHSFHSSEWDHSYPLAGKRAAVIGTGASAVQLVPEIAAQLDRLTVFQRTGNWFLPRLNRRYNSLIRSLVAGVPGLQALRRKFVFEYTESLTLTIRHPRTLGRVAALRSGAFMRSQLKDPALRAKAWPDYTFGCKRILFSSHFLPALERPNVELVTDAITSIAPEGVVTADGRLHEVDCLIWATGFKTNDFMLPMQVSGRDGRSLEDVWKDGAHAHLGMSVAGFPNMFVMYGPNTNTSGGSIIVYLEAQASYLRQALEQLSRRSAGAIEVRPEVEASSDREVQARFAGTAWLECDSWYRDEHGRIVANWPGYMREYLKRTSTLDASEFQFAPLPARAAARA
ncbi:MAG TPA: NAD(P)/FAD-dependent oxidoreductase [Solirubrobacteraceae bacterium]|jgi:cation diffusion facilitator CzcD-associated flavoprotein CzcO|nr:NAD(P)/FAD-dependent oxidoreductase [Solirubrobacteraceae bacterium]